ncbi:family 16 glycosylhydrolase [Devosia sp.]|uniref:glycoside hydrolase family 16 protein n=1 Tax=Devosia sp. TaxID=1871048 RepID=UPI003A8DD91B
MSEGSWTLRFVDEFDAPSLDGDSWTTCYWWNDRGCTNKGNSELQWYLAENVSVADGLLKLQARASPTEVDGRTYPYTSGMVTSGRYYVEREQPDRFSFTYGYVEVRAKMPSGKGLWPAIWLLPSDHTSKPEIDIMEALGRAPDVLETHYHYQLADRTHIVGKSTATSDLSRKFHRYGVEWSANEIRWYLDGREIWRVSEGVPIASRPMYLLMNLAVGGEWAGPDVDSARLPADLFVDYVKIWQQAPS